MSKFTPEQLRNSAGYTEALLVKRGLELVTVEAVGHMEQLRAHASALEDRKALVEVLTELIAAWRDDPGHRFDVAMSDARALLARMGE